MKNNKLLDLLGLEKLKSDNLYYRMLKSAVATNLVTTLVSICLYIIYNPECLITLTPKDNLQILTLVLCSNLITLPIFLTRYFKKVTAPIEETIKILTEYSQGNFNVELPLPESSEVRSILNNFTKIISELDTYRKSIDQKVLEQTAALREANKKVAMANEAKSQFLATMSHELRTPLNGICSYIELIKLSALDPTQLKDVEAIEACAKSLLQMVDDLLEFSSLETNSLNVKYESIELPDLLDKIGKKTKAFADEKEQTFILHIDEELPHTVIGDPKKIESLLMHLLKNAVKFSPKEAGVMLIAKPINKFQEGELVHFIVSDSGQGISQSIQNQIFEAFTQGENSIKRTFGGMGLGLSICSRLVSLMEGEIWVKSKENVGSSFHCTIPFKIPSQFN